MNNFYLHYSSDPIIKLVAQHSKEWDLYKWFLEHPKDVFKDNLTAHSDYVLNHIVDESLFVKKEFIMQMLDEMGVLSF